MFLVPLCKPDYLFHFIVQMSFILKVLLAGLLWEGGVALYLYTPQPRLPKWDLVRIHPSESIRGQSLLVCTSNHLSMHFNLVPCHFYAPGAVLL
jgi:hypothetical protein